MFGFSKNEGGKRVSFATVGCRLNQAEADASRDEFAQRGWDIVDFGQPADVVMINTCTVTGRADRSSRQLIHRARRINPEATVIAAGCFAAGHAEDLVSEGEVDLVLGVDEKNRPFDFLPESRPDSPEVFVNVGDGSNAVPAVGTRVSGRSRAFLKVQDGCDHACAYCAVTLVRGPSRSAPREDIRSAISRIQAAGFEEVVFTGVDLSSWGRNFEGETGDYISLVEMAAEMGVPRIRVSSLEPWELSPERIQRLAAVPQWCEHFHISLQSADEELLSRMNRPTDLGRLRETIAELLRLRPSATVGADMIVGFPGETEIALRNSLNFLAEGPLHYLHVFPYSPRPGTPAYELDGALDRETIHDRARRLREAAAEARRTRLTEMLGNRDEVLVEEDGKSGYTRAYHRVRITSGSYEPRSRVVVELTALDDSNDRLLARGV
jgi:threonylcarbamoyladenosine tRNA methylthiotransferase MtaB